MPINIQIDDAENTNIQVLRQTAHYLLALSGQPVPVSNDDIARFLQEFTAQGLGQPTTPAANEPEQDPVREQAEKNSDAAPPPPPPPPAREQVADPLTFGNSPMPAGATPLTSSAPPPPPPAPAGSAAAPAGSPPPPPPPAAPAVGTLDNNGLPWDERIHAGTKTTNRDGTWKAKRNIDAALVTQVEAELRALMAGAPQTAAAPTPAAGTGAPPPPPPAAAPASGQLWTAFLMKVSKARSESKHTMAQLDEVCAAHGVPKFSLLSNRLDLLPVVETDLEMRGLL